MPNLIRRIKKGRLYLLVVPFALLALVLGLPLLNISQQSEAANIDITNGIFLSGPDGEILDHNATSNVAINMGDSSITVNVPAGGSATATVSGTSAAVTRNGQSVSVPIPSGTGTYTVVITYTDDNGQSCSWTIEVTRTPGTKFSQDGGSGSGQDDNALYDSPLGPTTSGCCSNTRCGECEESSSQNGTSSPSSDSDSGGGDEDVSPGSLYWKLPFGLLPNEPDLESGALVLAASHAGENTANIANLVYTSVATMGIFQEKTTGLPSGVSYRCAIRQASGYPVWFQIKSGETLGLPRANTINSRARIELLDTNGSATSNPASATYIRQYRAMGGIVTFDRSTGKVTEYQTRQGRVTDFTGTDKIHIIYSDVAKTKIKQIRTAAGLLTITEDAARKYTVKIYAPGQFSTTLSGGEYPVNGGATPRRTAVVESLAASPEKTSIKVTHGTRTHEYDYEFSLGHGTSEWKMARKVDGVLTVEKSKKVEYGANGRTTTKRVVDKGPNSIPGASGDGTVKSSEVSSPKAEYGGYRHEASSVTETSKATSTEKIGRSFEFHKTSSEAGKYGKLKSHTLSDGRTFAYDYVAEGRMSKRTSTWLDDEDGKVEEYSYARHAETGLTLTILDAGDYRPRTTTVKLGGNVHRITYFESYTDGSNNDEYVEISEVGATTTSGFGDSANFRTVRRYYGPNAGSALQGRLKSVVNYDGTGSKYTYSAGSSHDTDLTTTVESTLDSSMSPVAAFSARTVIVRDSRGDMRSSTSGVYPRGASAYTDHRKVTCTYSDTGYKTKEEEEDLLTNRVRVLAEYTWANGLMTAMTDATGVDYTYSYDAYDRLVSTTRAAIAASGAFEAQSAITTSVDEANSTLAYNGGKFGWLKTTTTVSAGGITLTSSSERDYRGRTGKTTDVNGYVTEYDINETGTQTVTTHPNGTTTTTNNYLDGRHKSTTGTASVPSYSAYSAAANGEFTSTRYVAVNNGPRYTTSVSNMLGQTVRNIRPALNGTTAATVTTTNHYQSGTGYLVRVSSDAANVPDTIMEYNGIGVLTRRGQSQDATLTLASDDRIIDIETGIESDGGDLWTVNETTTYPDTSSATAKLLGTSRSQLAGFSGDVLSRNESMDINGNLSYSETELQLSGDGAPEGITTTTIKAASATSTSVTQGYYGRTETVSFPGITGLVTYGYDALGRNIDTKDPRHTGDSNTVYQSNKILVASTTNAKGETTSYSYYGNGVLGAGRVQTTTLPDSSTVHTSYDGHGLIVAEWGSQTYSRHNTYNMYDELVNLRTWQTDPNGDFSDLTGAAKTTWSYDAATGILLSKRDHNDKGADYEYDTANRLTKRTWARGAITDYTYTVWGELDTVTYPGDITGTRPLDYNYDRIGRSSTVTQTGTTLTPGTNTHTFAYNSGNLLVDTETVAYGNSGITRVLDHTQDTYLRVSQHLLKQTGGTVEHKVDLAYYAADGRLNTVTDNTGTAKTFTYNYEASNYRLLDTVAGPVHTVDNDYEANRDILTDKENKETSGNNIRSNYVYVTNNLGQRTSLTRSGSEMSAANAIGWTYNSRGELDKEDYGNNGTADTRDRVFSYDAIGNRQKTAEGTLTLPVTANYTLDVNRLNQYTSVNTNGTAVSPAHDADGNMTSGQLPKYQGNLATLVWDGENRLTKVTAHNGDVTTFEYDYRGRRIGKTHTLSGNTANPTETFIYEGWNLCAKYTGPTLTKTYTWGADLSGSMQEAGGVGGLLMVTEHSGGGSSHYYATYDGNGNVSEYLDSAGASVAHYEYDAFGKTVSSSGTKVADFAHRFSTKYIDGETELYYYGYRYYDVGIGRWLSRDPIGEAGGINLYGFIDNDSNNNIDLLGLFNLIGAGIGAGIDIALQLAEGKSFSEIDWLSVGTSAVLGGIFPGAGKILGKLGKFFKQSKKHLETLEKWRKRRNAIRKARLARRAAEQKAKMALTKLQAAAIAGLIVVKSVISKLIKYLRSPCVCKIKLVLFPINRGKLGLALPDKDAENIISKGIQVDSRGGVPTAWAESIHAYKKCEKVGDPCPERGTPFTGFNDTVFWPDDRFVYRIKGHYLGGKCERLKN